jgi:rhodanese-related sulfurtransferase
MSTLLSRIFGRKTTKTAEPVRDDSRIDVSALKPLMSPNEFAELQAKHAPAAPPSTDPNDLNGAWPMEQVLKTFPSAQRSLFQKFHIGGCSSCGYMPHDSLDKVSRDHGLETEKVVAFIKESADLEKDLEISAAEAAHLLKQGAIKILDVRTPEEYQIAHVEGSVLVDQAIAQEIVSTWPADSRLVTMCHHGVRSLDAAAYLRGHGFKNTRSMSGGIDAWAATVDPSVPRY